MRYARCLGSVVAAWLALGWAPVLAGDGVAGAAAGVGAVPAAFPAVAVDPHRRYPDRGFTRRWPLERSPYAWRYRAWRPSPWSELRHRPYYAARPPYAWSYPPGGRGGHVWRPYAYSWDPYGPPYAIPYGGRPHAWSRLY
jgi:hypothetical protein